MLAVNPVHVKSSRNEPGTQHPHPQQQQQQQPAYSVTESASVEEMKEAAAGHFGTAHEGNDSDDGSYDSPVTERSRRRFVKPTVTTYEHCFSRNAMGRRFNRRIGNQPRIGLASYSFLNNSNNNHSLPSASPAGLSNFSSLNYAADALNEVSPAPAPHPSTVAKQGVPRVPAVSSLSSVLNEVMHGRQRALSSYVDATAPQTNTRRFVVRQDQDGAFFVASSAVHKHTGDSASDKAFVRPSPKKSASATPPTVTSPSSYSSSPMMRRSDLDVSRSRKWPMRRSLHHGDSRESSTTDGRGSLVSSKVKLLGFSSIKSKLAARRSSHSNRSSMTRGGVGADTPMTLDEIEHDTPAVLGGTHEIAHRHGGDDDNALPMLDPDLVDTRARGDSSWEVPPAPAPAPAAGFTHQPLTDAQKQQIVNRPLPYQSLHDDADDEEDEDDDNLLNRSFLNVRDIEFHPRTDKEEKPVSVPVDELDAAEKDSDEDEDDEHSRHDGDRRDRTTSSDAESQSAASAQDAGRGSSFSGAAGCVRVSSSSANVSEFLGGFKGQLSTRRGGAGPDGFVNRARSVRNSRKSAANQAATVLTRKLREARSRIPLEFRDDKPLKYSKKKKGKKLRVRWDTTDYVREFEVESEEETEPEIVKAPWEYRDSEERESDSEEVSEGEKW